MLVEKKFILISNQRCGSTWFITSLGNCLNFKTDYEIKWSKELLLGKASPYHLFLEKVNLDQIYKQAFDYECNLSYASKFVFDFYKPFPIDSYDKFQSKFKDFNVLHIKRDYINILKSKLIGRVTHVVDKKYIEKNRLIDQIILDKQEEYLRIQNIAKKKKNQINFNIAKSYLLNLFINDLLSLSIKNTNNFLSINYEEIKKNLNEISEFLKVPYENLRKNLYDKPVINKNSIEYEDSFENFIELKKINKTLKDKLKKIDHNSFDLNKMIYYDNKNKKLNINI